MTIGSSKIMKEKKDCFTHSTSFTSHISSILFIFHILCSYLSSIFFFSFHRLLDLKVFHVSQSSRHCITPHHSIARQSFYVADFNISSFLAVICIFKYSGGYVQLFNKSQIQRLTKVSCLFSVFWNKGEVVFCLCITVSALCGLRVKP